MDLSPLAYWLNVKGSMLYLPQNAMPFGTAEQWGYEQRRKIKIAEYKNHPVYLLLDIDESLEYKSLRTQLLVSEEELFLFHRAVGLMHFFSQQRYCGHCASPTCIDEKMIAVLCEKCRYLNFPRISPCIIVGIRRGNDILLAHHARHKAPLYTVLAGFVEMGETIEQAVHREVFEESGLLVDNLRYVGSQPWSFPNSLMMGFIADYVGGEISIQPNELKSAKWFDAREKLTVELPSTGTIAREIIERMIEEINH